ncbi:hypothetical protein [Maricaulis alexandrii]|uniref:hypothetical protein n=1 Tax=Maricaulis alexandrii TaxID=2570354 RepID=UPI0011092F66|nr:hypothetical protein [Maricaulis alexandrii]
MYTEDGFELRPVGDTMEIYASGEIFHEPEPHVVLALRRMQTYFPTTKILSDVRLAAYVLEPDEHDHRSSAIAEVMKDFTLAVICLSEQRPFIEQTADKIRARGGRVKIFSSKGEARDWLESQPAGPVEPMETAASTAHVWQQRERQAG